MRRTKALINGTLVQLNQVETAEEYREGARASGDTLTEDEGYLFTYETPMTLGFENTGVPYDLRLLFVKEIPGTSPKQGVVTETGTLLRDSSKVVGSFLPHSTAIELRSDFCERYKLGMGSIVTFYNVEDEDV
jgi:uncharacterized membrane protein (UPF0127 family)